LFSLILFAFSFFEALHKAIENLALYKIDLVFNKKVILLLRVIFLLPFVLPHVSFVGLIPLPLFLLSQYDLLFLVPFVEKLETFFFGRPALVVSLFILIIHIWHFVSLFIIVKRIGLSVFVGQII
jgi:hypothetical protein